MNAKLKTMIGAQIWEFEIEATDTGDFWRKAAVISSFPRKCKNCQSEDLSFVHRSPKGYNYYEIGCNACGHALKYGQHQEGGLFFSKGWEAPYQSDPSIPPHPGGFAEE
jgi:hypothetical protein